MRMLKKQVKKIIALTFTLAMIITFTMYGVSAFGSESISLDKQGYIPLQEMSIKVIGLTDQQIADQRAWIGIFKVNARSDSYIDTKEVSGLDVTSTWVTKAPEDLGSYEVRLYTIVDSKDVLISNSPFIVESRKAKEGDVSLSKNKLTVNETATITIKGLLDSQIDDKAWVGIFASGSANDNCIIYEYISSLAGSDARTWTFNAPKDFGNYELRVFTKDIPGDKALQTVLYDTKQFSIDSTTADISDVSISKDFLLVNEKVTVTIKSLKESKTGLTDEQVLDNAWVGLYKSDDDVNKSDYIQWEYISKLGKSPYQWTFAAPKDYGKYKVIVFTKDIDQGKRSTAQYNTTLLSLTVGSKPANNGDVTLSKEEFLVGDNVTLALKQEALTPEQIDDGAWFGVFYSTDLLNAQPLYSDTVSVIRNKKFTTDFEIPSELGNYELRVFTKGTSDAEILKQAKFSATPFKVVSNKSKDKNDLKTDTGNQKYKMGEAINVIIKTYGSQSESEQAIKSGKAGELTPGQVKHGAWAGLFKLGDSNAANPIITISLNDNSTIRRKTSDGSLIWSFQAPTAPGEYIIKAFTQSTADDKRDPVFYAELPITVLNATKVTVSKGSFNWADYTLQVTPNPINIKVGSKVTLNVVAKPKKGAISATPTTVNNLVKFSSKDPKVAKIGVNSLGKGVVTGVSKIVKKGKTQIVITAKDNSRFRCIVNVTIK